MEPRIDESTHRVRYTMNGFVISVGCYVTPLLERARETAAIGPDNPGKGSLSP